MRYDNEIKITMRTTQMAEKAVEVLRTRLAAGFACDKDYRSNPSQRLSEDLKIEGRIIKVPFDCGYYTPVDALTVMCELAENLAKAFAKNTFTFENCNWSDYDMSRVDAKFKKGVLEIQTIYYPNGYCEEYFCPECGEVVVYAEDYVEGKFKTTLIIITEGFAFNAGIHNTPPSTNIDKCAFTKRASFFERFSSRKIFYFFIVPQSS